MSDFLWKRVHFHSKSRMSENSLLCHSINHVQVIGRPLSPVFDVEMIDEGGKCILKYNPVMRINFSPVEIAEAESSRRSHFHRFSQSIRTWEQRILNTFRAAGPLVIDDYDSDYEYLN